MIVANLTRYIYKKRAVYRPFANFRKVNDEITAKYFFDDVMESEGFIYGNSGSP